MGGVGCGSLFEAGRLLTFSAFRMGAYSRWALILGGVLIRINTICWVVSAKIQFVIISPVTNKRFSSVILTMPNLLF